MKKPKTRRVRHFIGERINNFVLKDELSKSFWLCLCDCGDEFTHTTHHLKRTKSCGCLSKSSRFARKYNRLQSIWQRRYNKHKHNAKRRKIPFDLTVEEVQHLLSLDCIYCGLKPHTLKPYARPKDTVDQTNASTIAISGIDRVDSSKSYTLDNCVSCCRWCNAAKAERNVHDFKKWVKTINENLFGK